MLYLHPQYVFMAWCLVKHKDNFNLLFYCYDTMFPNLKQPPVGQMGALPARHQMRGLAPEQLHRGLRSLVQQMMDLR